MSRGWDVGGRRAADRVEVELVEWPDGDQVHHVGALDDSASAASSGPVTGGPATGDLGPEPGPRRRRTAVRWAVGLTVVVVVVVAANVAEARRHEAHAAVLAELPWIVAPMPEPLTEQWRVSGSWVAGEAGGLLLITDDAGGVVAVDPETGLVRWTHAPTADGGTGNTYCSPVATGAGNDPVGLRDLAGSFDPSATIVLCQPYGGVVDEDANGTGARTVSALEPSTGESMLSVEIAGALLDTFVVGDGLVVASSTPGDHLRLQRWELGTGTESWSVEDAAPLVWAGGYLRERYRVGDALVVEGQETTVARSLVTGQGIDPVPARDLSDSLGTYALPDGGVVTWDYTADGPGSGHVADADGVVRYELPGPAVMPAVADGTVSDVLLVRDTGYTTLIALDVRTGEELWRSESGGFVRAQIDGVLVTGGLAVVRAIKVTDGSVLWESAIDGVVRLDGVSDGAVVLVVVAEGGSSHLAALDLTDGTEVWRGPVPTGTIMVGAVGGHVIASTGDEVIGLG
ncbi:PQQ-binding-like beta-propeller repeat protein [Cellulomonas sp. KRMCY2]|uniref:outer membrane protein assembly factor BamB family protein n=1 Tax=Cellulomonas sp. KRMCY2 TaxID=1304865 RepID=UPI00045EC156|nr:PQQ-binding-like beta-propeller repeat protein [Cellulomonas sp. KRMCY2]